MTAPTFTILEALNGASIWSKWFRNPATWAAWRAFLAALFGLPMSAAELALFQECTGREEPIPGGWLEA